MTRRKGPAFKCTAELGLAPADAGLTQTSVQGFAAGWEVLEKAAVPAHLQTQFVMRKAGIEALLALRG